VNTKSAAVRFWFEVAPKIHANLLHQIIQMKFCSLQAIFVSGVPWINLAFGVQHASSGSNWEWPGAPPWLSSLLTCPLSAYIAAYNPIHWYPDLLMECSIGFSGVIFAMIVIETSLSTAQTRRYIILDTMHFFTYTSLFQSFQIKDLSCYRIRPWTHLSKWEIIVCFVQHFWILHS
jgi:hypothetical protein